MAVNRKLLECTEMTTAPAADDALYIVDVDDTSEDPTGTSKFIEWLNIIKFLFGSRFAADAGSNDTYVVTLDPAPAAYVTGEHYRFKANTANTGACTVNFNSLGAKTIKKAAGGITTDLADNEIRAGQWVDLVYDGTNMQMQSPSGDATTKTYVDALVVAGTGPTGAAGGDLTGTYPNPTVGAAAVGNTKLANMAQATIKGRASGAGTGDPSDLSASDVRSILLEMQRWVINFTANGDAYIAADVAMTIDAGVAAIGTGTLAYEKSTTAAPSTFSSTTLPATLQAGAWLKITVSSITGFKVVELKRTA